MKRFYVLLLSCVLLQSAVHARAQATPLLSEVLAWINSHFQLVQFHSTGGGSTRITIESTSISLQGCQVSLHELHQTIDHYSGRPDARDERDMLASFALRDLRPDTIRVASYPPEPGRSEPSHYSILISARSPVPCSNTGPDVPALSSNSPVGAFEVYFAMRDMANRQAKAWHDAIVVCGGKAVPDNLY